MDDAEAGFLHDITFIILGYTAMTIIHRELTKMSNQISFF